MPPSRGLEIMENAASHPFVQTTYIYHDSFLIETPTAFILFDFWKRPDSIEEFIPGIVDSGKKLYVLVSHHHKDHFNKKIFEWQHLFPAGGIFYILSKDTERNIRYMLRDSSLYKGTRVLKENYTVLRPGEEWNDSAVNVRAFGSTDIGNSYLVKIAGQTIFHAGDLNAWVWKDESTPEEIESAILSFEEIVKGISIYSPKIDLAMFPVDSRIGRDYWEGAYRFVRMIEVERFLPMHFELAENENERTARVKDALNFLEYRNPFRGEYIALTAPGQKYLYIAW